jgi:uncharacterized spore protein YtfJ
MSATLAAMELKNAVPPFGGGGGGGLFIPPSATLFYKKNKSLFTAWNHAASASSASYSINESQN